MPTGPAFLLQSGSGVAVRSCPPVCLTAGPRLSVPQVLAYARKVLEVGMSPGVLMIDTNWAMYYGSNQFDASRFPDPKQMIAELHSLGFKVDLCPHPQAPPCSPSPALPARVAPPLPHRQWGRR